MTLHILKLRPLQPFTQMTVSKVLHFFSKNLKTVNVSQKIHGFKPCTKAEIDFVEIKCLVLMGFESQSA